MAQFKDYPSDSDKDRTFLRVLDHPSIPDSELIVTYNARRARKDSADRQRVLDKLNTALAGGQEPSVKKVISNSAYKKFTKTKQGSVFGKDS